MHKDSSNSMIAKELYDNIEAMCGRSRGAIAATTGVDSETVRNWKRGVSMPSLKDLERVREALGVSWDRLMTGRDREPAVPLDCPHGRITRSRCDLLARLATMLGDVAKILTGDEERLRLLVSRLESEVQGLSQSARSDGRKA